MKRSTILAAVIVVGAIVLLFTCAYTIQENEQAVIVVFGKVEQVIIEPGLHFKAPWADARKFEKRWLEWDGEPSQITTRDKRYIAIDVFARWRIADLNTFVEKLNNETTAQSRLDDIIDSATRNVVANHNLIEAIRTTNRAFSENDEEAKASGGVEAEEDGTAAQPDATAEGATVEDQAAAVEEPVPAADGGVDDEGAEEAAEEARAILAGSIPAPNAGRMAQDGGAPSNDSGYSITVGRQKLTRLILDRAAQEAAKLGIEIKDVQIKRIDYIASVQAKVFDRMISERRRVAEAYRSQGQGLSAEILGQKDREYKSIRSEAYKQAEEIKGRADGEAAAIYAKAYNKDPELYQFLKTMESYQLAIDEETWLLLTTEADYARFMSRMK